MKFRSNIADGELTPSVTETTPMVTHRRWERNNNSGGNNGNKYGQNSKTTYFIRPRRRAFLWAVVTIIGIICAVSVHLIIPSVNAAQKPSVVRLNHPNAHQGTAVSNEEDRLRRSVYSIQYYFDEDEDSGKKKKLVKRPVAADESFDAEADFDSKPAADRPEVGQSTAVAGATVIDSRAQLAKKLPKNVEGMSTLNAVSVPTLIKAREMKITTLFGPSNSDISSMKALLPKEFDDPNQEGDRIAYALLIEMQADALLFIPTNVEQTAKYYRRFRSKSPVEKAKAITMNMMDKGRPIHCHVGTDEFEKTVECISMAGIIDSCVKTVGKTGQTYRGCGLAGHRERGCHNTPSGQVCFCHSDLCNAGIRTMVMPGNMLALLLASLISYGTVYIWASGRFFGGLIWL